MRYLGMIFSAALLSASLTSMAGGFHVGNGGSGIVLSGKVRLLDLAGGLRHRWVGREILPVFTQGRFGRAIEKLDGPERLLARKLSDAEIRYAGLGVYLAEVIALYQWRYVPAINGRTKDSPSHIATVQLAVRDRGAILIDSRHWARMDAIDRAALIIHEAVYSLYEPYAFYDPSVDRSAGELDARIVRSLVVRLFRYEDRSPRPFSDFLNIPRFRCAGGDTYSVEDDRRKLESVRFTANRHGELLKLFAFCAGIPPESRVQVVAQRTPYVVTRAAENFQVSLRPVPGELIARIQVRDERHCRKAIARLLEKWFRYAPTFGGRVDSEDRCLIRLPFPGDQ